MMAQPLKPHRRAPERKQQPKDDDDCNVAWLAYAQKAVAQRRDEHSKKACGCDEAELLEELRNQQPDIHRRSLAAFARRAWSRIDGLRYRRSDEVPTLLAAVLPGLARVRERHSP